MATRDGHRPFRRTGARSPAATAAEAPAAAEALAAAEDPTAAEQVPAAAGTATTVVDHMASAAWQLETGDETQVAEVGLNTLTWRNRRIHAHMYLYLFIYLFFGHNHTS